MNRFCFILLLLFVFTAGLWADDAGIAEVRFIEEQNNTYVLEVDVPPSLMNTIRPPILPQSCTFTNKPVVISMSPLMVVRFRFNSGEKPLAKTDELLLYWQRSGIVLTAYWLDGSSKRVFLNRDLTGIRVPIADLREVIVNNKALAIKSMDSARKELQSYWILYLLLVISCVAVRPGYSLIKLLLALVFGHGLSLLAIDLGIPAIFENGLHVLIGLTALLIMLQSMGDKKTKGRLWPILMVLGFLQGLSFSGPDFNQGVSVSVDQQILSRFFYNAVFALSFAILAGLLVFVVGLMKKSKVALKGAKPLMYILGGLVVAQILILLPELFTTKKILQVKELPQIEVNSVAQNNVRGISQKVDMEYPLMGYITVTPFEIRCEWLVRVKDLNTETELDKNGETVIPVTSQAALKTEVLSHLSEHTIMSVDEMIVQPAYSNINFVSVATYGVTVKQNALPEPLQDAVLGVTLAYAVDEAPETVNMELKGNELKTSTVPVAFTDPWGTILHELANGKNTASWKRRMAGFRRPVIKAVTIQYPTWSVVSFVFLLVAIALVLFAKKGYLGRHKQSIAVLCVLLAFLLYPFIRVPAPKLFSKQMASIDESSKALNNLLTNIYRAFDYRTEEAIYDQLAISATGDQLSEIYLEQRSAMELEDRGGARASVDLVEILEVNDIVAGELGFTMDASWVVSGSVSHFGHIHYRKNRYDAVVHIIPENGTWRISGMDVKEKERIL